VAKSTKTEKSERQKVIEDIRRKQMSADQRQGRVIVGVCVLVALVIIGLAAYNPVRTWIEKQQYSGKPLEDIGASADVCGEITTKKAEGNNDHRPTGEQITYDDVPPAFGPHWNEAGVAPAPINERYYTDDTRPELESLMHNSEHGYTILWYDEEAADSASMIGEIKAIAATLDENDTNGRYKFKAVPWTDEDGEDFPDGQHIAFTHWTAEPQEGVWQYCSEPSGEALQDFMKKYPFTNSPEPNVF
jgi:hypothetical protein